MTSKARRDGTPDPKDAFLDVLAVDRISGTFLQLFLGARAAAGSLDARDSARRPAVVDGSG